MRQTETISWFFLLAFMGLSWGFGLYFYSILLNPMVIELDQYYWVHPFWGMFTGTLFASALTLLGGALLKWVRAKHRNSSQWPGLTMNGVTGLIWVYTIYMQVQFFNLNEGICH